LPPRGIGRTLTDDGFSAGLLSRFSFSPITNQSNDRLFLAGIAEEKCMPVFALPFLDRIYYEFLFADKD
jgi:hypothetical protein